MAAAKVSHDSEGAVALAVEHERSDHSTRGTGQAQGGSRAKHLGIGAVNPHLEAARVRVVEMLVALFGEEKGITLGAMFSVSRTYAMRWLDREHVNKNPMPVAALLTCDDQSFEQIVEALRRDRVAMREGR